MICACRQRLRCLCWRGQRSTLPGSRPSRWPRPRPRCSISRWSGSPGTACTCPGCSTIMVSTTVDLSWLIRIIVYAYMDWNVLSSKLSCCYKTFFSKLICKMSMYTFSKCPFHILLWHIYLLWLYITFVCIFFISFYWLILRRTLLHTVGELKGEI